MIWIGQGGLILLMYPHPSSFLRSVGADTATTPSAGGVISEADFASVDAEDRIENLGRTV